jgi:hypothetical protein
MDPPDVIPSLVAALFRNREQYIPWRSWMRTRASRHAVGSKFNYELGVAPLSVAELSP